MLTVDAKPATEILRNTGFFSGTEEKALARFAACCIEETIPSGTPILTKDKPGRSLYVIVCGRAEVHDEELTLATLGEGDSFGELSTLEDGPCSASVTAQTDLTLLRLDRNVILQVMAEYPECNAAIMQSLCRTLRERSEQFIHGVHLRRTLERELEIGRKIQAGFLPSGLPREDGWDIGAYFHAAREVAGDFYDVFRVDYANRIALVIGDVCDKGVGAALFMTLFRSLLRASATSQEFLGSLGPADVLPHDRALGLLGSSVRFANDYIARTHGDTSMFATIFFGLLDPSDGHLFYVNAGHEAPMILSGQGEIRAELENTGPVLGLFTGVPFGIGEASLQPGDTFFAFTDGATDALNIEGEAFGMERLVRHLGESRLPADRLVSATAAVINDYAAGREQYDDLTMLAASRHPRS